MTLTKLNFVKNCISFTTVHVLETMIMEKMTIINVT